MNSQDEGELDLVQLCIYTAVVNEGSMTIHSDVVNIQMCVEVEKLEVSSRQRG